MQINIKDCIENSLQKHVLSLKFVTYQIADIPVDDDKCFSLCHVALGELSDRGYLKGL